MGYLRFAERLRDLGHNVTWITTGVVAERVRAAQFSVNDFPGIGDLSLPQLRRCLTESEIAEGILRSLADLLNHLADIPDAVLCDRALTFAPLALGQMHSPYIAIGTPGGTWRCAHSGVTPWIAPVTQYQTVGEAVKRRLGWRRGELSSAWVDSPWLNVAFVGRSFFQPDSIDDARSAMVRHYSDIGAAYGYRIGISFGTTGDCSVLLKVLERLVTSTDLGPYFDVFTGNRNELRERIAQTPACKHVSVHGWVRFADFFPKLALLIFFGGIGTLWECVNHWLPMAVIPGSYGDQDHNGHAVETLGLGLTISVTAANSSTSFMNRLAGMRNSEAFRPAFEEFRAKMNSTDTMDSLCERLENLVKSG